jgi:hypothetical protein
MLASCITTPAFALTPEQQAASDRAYAFIERAAECGDTVRKAGMKDYALELAEQELAAAGLPADQIVTLTLEMVERANSELTIETLAQAEAECLAVAPQELRDWLNEAWIPATAPNYGWWHGEEQPDGHGGAFRFEDDTAIDYRCADEDVFNVGDEEDWTKKASRVISIYVWDDHTGNGYLSVDGRALAELDFVYTSEVESSFAQIHVGTDSPQAERDTFDTLIDAIATGSLMRITTGAGSIVEIPLDGAEPIEACRV